MINIVRADIARAAVRAAHHLIAAPEGRDEIHVVIADLVDAVVAVFEEGLGFPLGFTPLEYLSLNTATVKALKGGGIDAVEQLACHCRWDLERLPHLNTGRIERIEAALAERGLTLADRRRP